MLPVDDAETLPLLYHFNSEPWLNLEAYNDPSNEVRFRELDDKRPAIALPAPASDSALFRLLEQRSSCRRFERRPLSLSLLAEILAGAYGITGLARLPNGTNLCARPIPSAGGLYPMEIYAAIQNVEGLADGIYRYHALYHFLQQTRAGLLMPQISSLLLEQNYLDEANAVLFITADLSRTAKKYGPRAYRYLLLEAGHCAQNICLLATENQLGSLCLGGFLDNKLNRFLALENREINLYCVAVGHAKSSP
jgi:SagB-type dehydrogenase family enzyme